MSKRRDLKAECAIADEHGISINDVQAVFDHHPVGSDKDRYLRRQLARSLYTLDELEVIFRTKAREGDVAAGTLVVKISERRASLLGLNAPAGFSESITQQPHNQETSLDPDRARA